MIYQWSQKLRNLETEKYKYAFLQGFHNETNNASRSVKFGSKLKSVFIFASSTHVFPDISSLRHICMHHAKITIINLEAIISFHTHTAFDISGLLRSLKTWYLLF